MKKLLVLSALCVTAWVAAPLQACENCGCKGKKAEGETVAKPQTVCPVLGGKIDKKQYVDVKGVRIYVCCEGCIAKIKADPDKYIAKVKANGETPEKAPEAKPEETKPAAAK
jgi:hypothetical protein